jgi:hypothetical protein
MNLRRWLSIVAVSGFILCVGRANAEPDAGVKPAATKGSGGGLFDPAKAAGSASTCSIRCSNGTTLEVFTTDLESCCSFCAFICQSSCTAYSAQDPWGDQVSC